MSDLDAMNMVNAQRPRQGRRRVGRFMHKGDASCSVSSP